MKKLIVLFVCFFVSAFASAADLPTDKEVINFDSKFGGVIFYHKLHADLRTNDCETCHHTFPNSGVIKACDACHIPDKLKKTAKPGDAPVVSKAFHVRCKGCHQYTVKELKKPAGPVSCALCHSGKDPRK